MSDDELMSVKADALELIKMLAQAGQQVAAIVNENFRRVEADFRDVAARLERIESRVGIEKQPT